MNKRIMILGASILQLPAIKKAKELGLNVIVVDMNPNAIGFKEDGVICEVISTIDTEKVLECAKKYKINGIMTLASDMPMRTVAVVSNAMGLVGPTEETALKATNKAAMRVALKKHGVPIPMFYCISTREEFLSAVRKIRSGGYKCIVKPADNSGSRGINLLEDYSDKNVNAAFDYSKKYSHSGEVMVEEFMEGPEVSVETLSIQGVCHVIQITDKLTSGVPFFVEMGHSQPSLLESNVQEKIRQVTIAANSAIGIKNGPSHTEIKVTKEGPKVVELGARLGGDNITTHLVPFSTGVDMVECCIRIALGEQPEYISKYNKASAIRYFETSEGYIKDIVGMDTAEQIPGIKQVSIVHGAGYHAGIIKNSIDRVGFVIAQSDTVENAVESCNKAMKVIKIVYNS